LRLKLVPASIALLVYLGSSPPPLIGGVVPCDPADASQLVSALAQIEASADPCGESSQVRQILASLRGCSERVYRVCVDTRIARNIFDRSPDAQGEDHARTITWNPSLRSELESTCEGDPGSPVRRDPVASLLHELVHAAHDCAGLDPGQNEMEAVRIENIYRRSAGLCQRAGYGDDLIPAQWLKSCTRTGCTCASPATIQARDDHAAPETSAPASTAGDQEAR